VLTPGGSSCRKASLKGGLQLGSSPALGVPRFRLSISVAIPLSAANTVPYLRAEEALVARWRERIGAYGFKIGIAWHGNPKVKINRERSFPLAEFFALGRLPGVRLISLQKQHGLDQ
jgi:hypothetical protein